jgi:hypothetical protein
MIENSYYSQEVHGPYELYDIGNLDLEEGGTVRGCKLAYATFGTLNAAEDNAILVPTWYSGTNKIIEQVFIGKGRALDPDKYFIVIINQIGNGLSTSPHNTAAPAGMGNFPHVRIGDDVRAQHKLGGPVCADAVGVVTLAAVAAADLRPGGDPALDIRRDRHGFEPAGRVEPLSQQIIEHLDAVFFRGARRFQRCIDQMKPEKRDCRDLDPGCGWNPR